MGKFSRMQIYDMKQFACNKIPIFWGKNLKKYFKMLSAEVFSKHAIFMPFLDDLV